MNKIVAPVKPLQAHRFAKQNENPKHLDYHRVPKSQVSPYCKYAEHVAFGRYKPGTFLPHLDLTISWPAHCHWSQEGCEPVILEVAWVARHQCPKQKVWLDKCQYIPWSLMWQSYTWKIGKSSITIEFPGISSLAPKATWSIAWPMSVTKEKATCYETTYPLHLVQSAGNIDPLAYHLKW